MWTNAGAVDAAKWLEALNPTATTPSRRHAEIALATLDAPASAKFDDRTDTRFHVDIYSAEWGFFFCHAGRVSWIRVTDVAFVHGRDEFHLLEDTPRLTEIGGLLRMVEQRCEVAFRRDRALVRSNIPLREPAIRRWVSSL